MRTVIAAYDNTHPAHGGLDAAARIAAATGCHLIIAHAIKPLRREREAHSIADLVEQDTKDRCEEWERRLAFAAQEAREMAEGMERSIEVSTELRVGPPAEQIAELAAERSADLVVAGTRGIGHVRQLIFGSFSQRLLEEAPCNVLFLREPLPPQPPQVVVGCDGSDWAKKAADIGQEIAAGFGSKLVLFHVAPYEGPFADSPFLSEESRETMRAELHERGERILHSFRERVAPQVEDIEEVVREGHVRGEFLEELEDRTPSIAVVGSKGESAIKNVLVGSVTRTLLDYSHSPVLVVKLEGEASPTE